MAGQASAMIRQCTGCGASSWFDGPALSTACSYCDSPMVDEARAATAFHSIVPFRVPERAALDALRAYLDGRRFAPRELRDLRLRRRGLRGVLVPFWVYEGVVRSEYRAKVGVYWYREESYKDPNGTTKTRRVRETEWFPLRGSAARQVEDHVVSASVGLPEREANALGPFDLGWATRYDPRLLSGFEAELPTIDEIDAEHTARDELRDAEAFRIQRELLPGDTNRVDWISSEIDVKSRRLVLLPVWIATARHGERVVRLVVNGQTGRVVGRVPVSKQKVAALVLAILTLVGVVALLGRWLGAWAG
ncbi:hypothetical protein [Enhygromyxa salina]|uniref:hypothetical protein n=1 Tax=Enhygromyxa salina TaxID=215803 RepID=UPI0011BA5701|nr:hypothetical protein [Enhygromyxa salina]